MTRLYCYLAGMLGLSLLGGSMGTLTVSKDQHLALVESLPADLVIKYEAIVKERRNHYIIGLVIGFLIAFIIYNLKLLYKKHLHMLHHQSQFQRLPSHHLLLPLRIH